MKFCLLTVALALPTIARGQFVDFQVRLASGFDEHQQLTTSPTALTILVNVAAAGTRIRQRKIGCDTGCWSR
jgi:hypothetical protein